MERQRHHLQKPNLNGFGFQQQVISIKYANLSHLRTKI